MPSFNSDYEVDMRKGEKGYSARMREEVKKTQARLREEKRKADLLEQKRKREEFLVDGRDSLTYMYLFGRDEIEGDLYERRASDDEAIILKEYFQDHIPAEAQEQYKNAYKKIMASKSDNWKVKAFQESLRSHDKSVEFAGNKRDEMESIIAENKRAEEAKKCSAGDYFKFWKPKKMGQCYNDNVIKPVLEPIGEGLSELTDFIMDIPVIGEDGILGAVSDAYELTKDLADDAAQALRESGSFGKFLYDAGDMVHETALKHVATKINPIFGQQILEGVMGTSIEDASLAQSGELIASTVSGGAAAVLLANDLIQANKENELYEAELTEQEQEAPETTEQEDTPNRPLLKPRDPRNPAPSQPVQRPMKKPLPSEPVQRPMREPLPPGPSCRPRRKPVPAC